MSVAPLVFDLGMHDGRDTAHYLQQGYRVVAVEADPYYVDRARKLFKDPIASGSLVIEHCGITATDGERTFYRNRRVGEWSSFDIGLAGRNGTEDVDEVNVPCRNPRLLFERHGIPHYLKCDLEGNDKHVLSAMRDMEIRPRFVSFEVMVVSDIDAVADLGYTEFQVVDQSQFLAKPGAKPTSNPSGPFGDALPGPWVSADEAARIYSEGRADPSRWFDVHGRFAA